MAKVVDYQDGCLPQKYPFSFRCETNCPSIVAGSYSFFFSFLLFCCIFCFVHMTTVSNEISVFGGKIVQFGKCATYCCGSYWEISCNLPDITLLATLLLSTRVVFSFFSFLIFCCIFSFMHIWQPMCHAFAIWRHSDFGYGFWKPFPTTEYWPLTFDFFYILYIIFFV